MRAEALDQLRGSTSQVWLLQSNPSKFDLFGAVKHDGLPSSWSVNHSLDQIQPGDRVVLWVSGPNAGVYALGEISSTPYKGTVDNKYAIDPNPYWDTFVEIDLFLGLFKRPVPRTVLKSDPRFANQSIITIPRAANPHKLDNAAFEAILERIAEAR